jgi:hypothetical protein
MSRPLAIAAVAVAVGMLSAPPAVAATSAPGPTPGQIRAAVTKAERSSDLWATVNVCNTRRHRGVIGIRAQQPPLGFSSTMSVRVQVEYWTGRTYQPDAAAGATKILQLGTTSSAVRQTGWNFHFGPHAGTLRGLVSFQWILGGKVLGSVTRTTTSGHTHVRFADPSGYSAAKCTIR